MRYALATCVLLLLLTRHLPCTAAPNNTAHSPHPLSSTPDHRASATECVTALTAISGEDDAAKLAATIVGAKLAACVNAVPNVKSYYWWKGKVVNDTEHILLIKTRAALVPRLRRLVRDEHPYDLAELIVHPIVDGAPEFLDWIAQSTLDPSLQQQQTD